MAKCNFRLQPVLDLRSIHRDRKYGELIEALAALRTLEVRRAEVIAEQQEVQEKVRTSRPGSPLDLQRAVEAQRYNQVLRDRLQEIARQEEHWGHEIERRQAMLDQAERDVKTLQKVKQRQQYQQRERGRKLEVQQLDEFALAKLQFQKRVYE